MRNTPKSAGIVYVVGAGFSAGLGFPTIQNVLTGLWPRLTPGQQSIIGEVVKFNHPKFDPTDPATFPDIERLLSEIDANVELFDSSRYLAGNFTKAELVERRRIILFEITRWFHELKSTATRASPTWLNDFVKHVLDERCQVVTFNWDLVLDGRLFRENISAESYGLGEVDSGSATRLLKPHGSLNWYEDSEARTLKADKRLLLAEDSESRFFAFKPLRAPISKVAGKTYMPLIVPPVYSKRFEGELFRRLWRETVSVISRASEVRFLGYSLAHADFHARFIFRCGFYNQLHGEIIGEHGDRARPTGQAKVSVVDTSDEPVARVEACAGLPVTHHRMTIEQWVSFRLVGT